MKGGFTKKSVRTLTLGEKLRNLRGERRISLNEVSRHTRIQLKYLEYLEEGNYKKLPADVYVKGFLRGYAEFLGVDENILIRLYEKEKGIKMNLEKIRNNNPEVSKPINISPFLITPKIIMISSVVILFFAGVFYLYKEIGAFANTPKLVIISPEQNVTLNASSVVVEGITDTDAKAFINDQPILVNDDGKFSENLALQSGTNTINVKAVNRFDKDTTQNIIVQSNYQEKQENTVAADINKAEIDKIQDKIVIEVSVSAGPVWVSAEADGNLVFSGTMLTGAIQTFTADTKVSINSGKANAIKIKFNGKDIGLLGDSDGPVRNVVFTKDTKY